MGRRRTIILLLSFATTMPAIAVAQGRRDVTGTVRAERDSTPLEGVIVIERGTGTTVVTDAAGRFLIGDVSRLPTLITFTRIGVAPDSVLLAGDRDELTVYLRLAPISLPAITAEARPTARIRFEREAQPSIVSVDRETIARVPAPFESDVIRTVQLLPGTVALNDYTVGFNVRGGEPDQNLTQLDGTTIFNPSHLGGLFSTFDTDAVEEVDFITGAFPAEYGGRLSSVLDVSVRPGRRDRLGVRGHVSLLASRLLLEGPAGSRASWLVSARRTYADVLAGALTSEVFPYHFWDAVGKGSLRLGTGGTLSVTGYAGRDVLDWLWQAAKPGQEEIRLEGTWGNQVLGVRFDQPLGRRDRLTVDGGITGFSARFGLQPRIVEAENIARLLSARARLILVPHRAHEVRVGAGLEDYRMRYDAGSESFGSSFLRMRYAPQVWSAFAEDQWRAASWLFLRPGVRVEAVRGPDVVNIAPRLGVKAFLDRGLALTGSVGRYHQAIHSLRDQNLPWNIFDFWIGADSAIPVGRADHVVVGVEWWFGAAESLTLEAYRKTFTDIIDANLNEDPAVQGDEIVPVSGDAWGIDVLVRRHWGRVTGWIAYSLTKATRRNDRGEYPAVHDRCHTINVVVQAPGPFGSDLAARLGYGSPLPYTAFVVEWDHRTYRAATHSWDNFNREPIASDDLNSTRYPYYGRFDVSLRWEIQKWGGMLRPYVQVANMLNRRNVFLYFYDYTTAPATRSAISQLPLLPSVGLEFAF
jgi:hypothetical protein